MVTLPTTLFNGTMLLDGVIFIASIEFEVNRYIATNFITLFYKYVKASRHAIPWPFTPAPTRSPVDCDVVGARYHLSLLAGRDTYPRNGIPR